MESFRVTGAPPEAYYIPNFINETEENELLSSIYTAPKPKWTHLSNRRLQNWGGIPHSKGMIAEEMPKWLTQYIERIAKLNIMNGKSPNHVLINEYKPGQGIMPHFDGSLYHPTITTISLKSHIVLKFQQPALDGGNLISAFSLLLEPRSLLVLKEDLFNKYLHTIEEIWDDLIDQSIVNLVNCYNKYEIGTTLERLDRISVTIRHVPKTSKLKLVF